MKHKRAVMLAMALVILALPLIVFGGEEIE